MIDNKKEIQSISILDLIGNTPLLELKKITEGIKGRVFAKLEAFNPGHSTKDRIALHIIDQAERKGILNPGTTIIETTSGNTGYSLAMICALKGYSCILAVTNKSSKDKINMLKALGVEVHVCPANVKSTDSRSYYQVAKRLHSEIKDSVYINQYFNDLNVEAHYKTTGPEIWNQTNGRVTHVLACCGTGGTLSGISKYLKEQNPEIRCIGVDAYGSVLKKFHETKELDSSEIYPYRIEGLGKNFIPATFDIDSIDEMIKVGDEESAVMAREISLKEGVFAGYTSGAAICALKNLDKSSFDEDSIIVVVFPDHGSRYMSKIYSNDWMKEQGFETNSIIPTLNETIG